MSASENEKEIFEKYARQAINEAILKKLKNGRFNCEERGTNDPESLCKSVLGILYELIITGKNQAYNNIINDTNLKPQITPILKAYKDENIRKEFNIKDTKFNKHLQEEKFKTLRKIRDHVVNPPTILRPMSFFNDPTTTTRSSLRSANGGKRRNTRRRNRKSNKTRKYKSRSRR